MLVESTKKSFAHIDFRPTLKEGETYNLHNVKSLHLIYGLNFVEDALWNDAKKQNPGVVAMLKRREILERGSEDISKKDEDKAVELVKKCFATDLLKGWSKDSRAAVADAAQEQLASIKDALHGGKKARAEA